MIKFNLDVLGFRVNFWVWIDIYDNDKKYHYQVPFFFMIIRKTCVPFSIGVVKRVDHEDETRNEGIFQILHYKFFQKRCKVS